MNGKTLITIALITFVMASPVTSLAHPGNTDDFGGHHDYENDSGLGYYHFHHGYGPHLHTNGVCPYASDRSNSTSSARKAVITSGNVKINGNVVNNASLKYPLISYNNITYFPLTYRNKMSLGLTHESRYGTIYITTGNSSSYTADIEGDSAVGKSVTVTVEAQHFYIDGDLYFNDESWPLLRYNDIIYIPMTYDLANTLKLNISWSQEDGLSVSSRKQNTIKPSTQVAQPQATSQQQAVNTAEPVVQFKTINTSARPVLNKNAVYYVYSLENPPKYLGKMSSNLFSEDSIFNSTGIYGNRNAETSLWNTYSRYCDFDSQYSIYNYNASYPPFIVDTNGYICGIITMNSKLDTPAVPAYTLSELMTIFS